MSLKQYTLNRYRINQIYRASERNDFYEHRILNTTSQLLKLNKKLIMTQNIVVLRHQFTLYVLQVVADLAIIKHAKIRFTTLFNMHKFL